MASPIGPEDDVEDAALLARIVSRDERAIEDLDRRFGSAMRAVAQRVTRNDPVAEEVVQDVLLAVWRDPARYDPARGTLGPWLLTLTRYKAIDAVRREAVIRRRTADVDLTLREAPDDVHDEVWMDMRRERLREAMTQLSDDQRHALELAFIGGLTHVEVAERLAIPLGTAKTRIRSGLLRLRGILGSSLEAERGPAAPATPFADRPPAAGRARPGGGPSAEPSRTNRR